MAVDYTFARPSPATVVGHEGIVRNCKIDEARFQGARRVENLVTDSDFSTWSLWGNGAVVTSGQTDPNGGATAYKINPTTGTVDAGLKQHGNLIVPGKHTLSVWLKGELGGEVISLNCGVTSAVGVFLTLTTEWERYSVLYDSVASYPIRTFAIIERNNPDGNTNFYAWNPQTEFLGGQSNQNPSEYVSNGLGDDHGCGKNVDGVKYFDYKNGNTVDANGVVTEAQGSAIKDVAYLNEAGATNFLHYSDGTIDEAYGSKHVSITDAPGIFSEQFFSNAARFPVNQGANVYCYFASAMEILDEVSEYVISFLLKKDNGAEPFVTDADASLNVDSDCRLVFENGLIPDPPVPYTKTALGNGVWRYDVIVQSTDNLSRNTGITKYTSNKQDSDLYFHAIQVELAPGPTSYIPTAGAAVSRAADTLSYTGVNVHEDFVAGCDVTPTISGSALNPVAGNSNHSMMANDDSRGNIAEFRTALNSDAESRIPLDSIVLPAFDNASVEQGVRNKFVVSEVSTGNGTEYKSVRQGAILIHDEFPGLTLDHGNTGTWVIGGNTLSPDKVSGLYHAFQLFDQSLTDEQLTYLSQPGNNPQGCS